MKFASPLLKRVVYPGLARMGYFRHRALAGELSVVTYHGVLPKGYQSTDPILDGNLVSTACLHAQLRLLKSQYNVISAEDVFLWLETGAKIPPRSVLLTCDDGLQNALTDMVPLLREEALSCLFFVTGASAEDRSCMLWYEELYLLLMAVPAGEFAFPELNQTAQFGAPGARRSLWWNWVRELSQCDAEARRKLLEIVRERCGLPEAWASPHQTGSARRRFFLLTADEVRQLVKAGMSVGAHTSSHPVLAQASSEMAWREIAESRKALEAVLGFPVWAMAYPFGDPASAGVREFEMAERAGYKCAFVNCGAGFSSSFPRFAIPRTHVTADMSLGEFEAHMSGFHEGLRRRFGRQDAAGSLQ
jgi:peptidoglycan/xylan/chitin deacetylase (PgdA/CDA1 family)